MVKGMKGLIVIMTLLMIGIGAITILKVATGSWGYTVGHTETGEVKFTTPMTYLLVGGGVLMIALGVLAIIRRDDRK